MRKLTKEERRKGEQKEMDAYKYGRDTIVVHASTCRAGMTHMKPLPNPKNPDTKKGNR